jgi:hypothetical protein
LPFFTADAGQSLNGGLSFLDRARGMFFKIFLERLNMWLEFALATTIQTLFQRFYAATLVLLDIAANRFGRHAG